MCLFLLDRYIILPYNIEKGVIICERKMELFRYISFDLNCDNVIDYNVRVIGNIHDNPELLQEAP